MSFVVKIFGVGVSAVAAYVQVHEIIVKQRKGVLTAIGLEIWNKLFIIRHLSCEDTGNC